MGRTGIHKGPSLEGRIRRGSQVHKQRVGLKKNGRIEKNDGLLCTGGLNATLGLCKARRVAQSFFGTDGGVFSLTGTEGLAEETAEERAFVVLALER